MPGFTQAIFIIFSLVTLLYLLFGLASGPNERFARTGTFLLAITLAFYAIQSVLS